MMQYKKYKSTSLKVELHCMMSKQTLHLYKLKEAQNEQWI